MSTSNRYEGDGWSSEIDETKDANPSIAAFVRNQAPVWVCPFLSLVAVKPADNISCRRVGQTLVDVLRVFSLDVLGIVAGYAQEWRHVTQFNTRAACSHRSTSYATHTH